MDYKFQRTRIDKIPREKMLDELEKVAKTFRYIEFGWRDFNKIANISANPIKKEFGTWKKALGALKEYLNKKGLDLLPRKVPPNRIHQDKDMFDEMEKVWNQLGHRPSRGEWESSGSKISYGTYKKRFNGWQNACLKFIEHKMGTAILVDNDINVNVEKSQQSEIKNNNGIISNRSVPLKIRLKVLDRDVYRCVFCGRSPATERGVQLHIDHKIPFSKGGRSTIDNLQTLCRDCNLGKSDEVYNR